MTPDSGVNLDSCHVSYGSNGNYTSGKLVRHMSRIHTAFWKEQTQLSVAADADLVNAPITLTSFHPTFHPLSSKEKKELFVDKVLLWTVKKYEDLDECENEYFRALFTCGKKDVPICTSELLVKAAYNKEAQIRARLIAFMNENQQEYALTTDCWTSRKYFIFSSHEEQHIFLILLH
jgi:hypothetical protein